MYKIALTITLIFITGISIFPQDVTTKNDSIVESMNSTLEELKKIKISGYVQPQYQLTESEGAATFSGGNFPAESKSRFMVRRGRLKLTYDNKLTKYVFQIDASERGFTIRDAYANIKDPWTKSFGLTAGLFDKPFGFETGYSSSLRESPERSRLFQTLFPGERDLGVMLSYIPEAGMLSFLNVQAGVFTGNGINSETDNYKDIIGRIGFTLPTDKKVFQLSGGVSGYFGNVQMDEGTTSYDLTSSNTVIDSTTRGFERAYLGADLQMNFHFTGLGNTALRGEYITGKQPGNQRASSYYRTGSGDLYLREFDGYYVMLVQDFGKSNQFVAKYDVYDPNRKDNDNDKLNSNLLIGNAGDVKYSTLGLGWIYHLDKNVKFTLYYEMIDNQETAYTPTDRQQILSFPDIKDNVLTVRMQYKF